MFASHGLLGVGFVFKEYITLVIQYLINCNTTIKIMVKNLKSFRLTSQSIEKIRTIQTDKNLDDETKALEHIITNFDMNNAKKVTPELQNVRVRI